VFAYTVSNQLTCAWKSPGTDVDTGNDDVISMCVDREDVVGIGREASNAHSVVYT